MNGVAYGGVAVSWKKAVFTSMEEIAYKNPEKFEMVVTATSLKGHSRKLVVVGCYLPPNYTKKRAVAAMDYLSDIVVDLKRRFQDPFIIIGGDFNQWRVEEALVDFVNIKEAPVGCTTGGRAIDRIFTNMRRPLRTAARWHRWKQKERSRYQATIG